MSLYKGYPIYGVAVPAPEHRWYSRGLVFDCDLSQTVEMKRIECTSRMLNTRKQAENADSNCAKSGLTSCLDAPSSRRYSYPR